MIFVKHIFDFSSQIAAQILMKFDSHMHVSKVTQEIIHNWFGEFPGVLVSSLFKLGRSDLYLRF